MARWRPTPGRHGRPPSGASSAFRMNDLVAPSIEEAVIRVCREWERASRISVDTFSSTFLAFNTVHGYSAVDFEHPDNAKLRELAAILELHCDFEQTRRFYTGLYLDMIWAINPRIQVVFTKDSRAFVSNAVPTGPSGARARGMHAARSAAPHAPEMFFRSD